MSTIREYVLERTILPEIKEIAGKYKQYLAGYSMSCGEVFDTVWTSSLKKAQLQTGDRGRYLQAYLGESDSQFTYKLNWL